MQFDFRAFLGRLLPALLAALLAGFGLVLVPPLVNPPPAPGPAPGPAPVASAGSQFCRGARPTPQSVILASPRFRPSLSAPAQFALVPDRLSMWGNNRYGDCVTAEECFAKVADAPNCFVSEATCIQWAAQHGVLNGAYLADVLDAMARDGIRAEDGKVYKDGPKKVVDWTNKAELESAISQGRVKIAVAADQIQQSVSVTGGQSGWAGVGWRSDDNTDHCTSLTGYGPAGYLYQQLGRPVPFGVDPQTYGYLMFTWNSIGFVDRPSLLAVTREAWFRTPTTAGFDPPPAPPPAPPGPAPQPGEGWTGHLRFERGALVDLTPGIPRCK